VVVVGDMLLLRARDGVVVLQQGHSFLQAVRVAPTVGRHLQLPAYLEVSGGLPDVPLGSGATNEVACNNPELMGLEHLASIHIPTFVVRGVPDAEIGGLRFNPGSVILGT